MPGPNSAPNGDRGLIRGHAEERFIFCKPCQEAREARVAEQLGVESVTLPPLRYPARSHAAKHGKLKTGKTALDKARQSH